MSATEFGEPLIGARETYPTCGDVHFGALLVDCECGKFREWNKPHAFACDCSQHHGARPVLMVTP